MKRLLAMVFCITLLVVSISCSQKRPQVTEPETAPDSGLSEHNSFPETDLPAESTSSLTTTSTPITTTIPPTTTTVPITTTVPLTTKAPSEVEKKAYEARLEETSQNLSQEQKEQIAANAATCRHCGRSKADGKHHRFINDMNCPDCGVLAKGMTCHVCAN